MSIKYPEEIKMDGIKRTLNKIRSGTNCKGCGKPIQFIKKPDGKYHVCEIQKLTIITKDGAVVSGYESHFANCPYADEFRSDRKSPES